jgi:hypothetical protein
VADLAFDFKGGRPEVGPPAVLEIGHNVGDSLCLPVAETDLAIVEKRQWLCAVAEQTRWTFRRGILHGSDMISVTGHGHAEDTYRPTEIESNPKTSPMKQ